LDQNLPDGRAKDVMHTQLETASMWAHKALAETAPLVEEAASVVDKVNAEVQDLNSETAPVGATSDDATPTDTQSETDPNTGTQSNPLISTPTQESADDGVSEAAQAAAEVAAEDEQK